MPMEVDVPAGGYDPDLFAELARLEQRHFWFSARAELIWWALQRHRPAASAMLEIGCGTGFVLAEMARRNPRLSLVGSELFAEGLVHARSRLGSRVALVRNDARRLPFRSAFDVVGAFDVIEHVEQDASVLEQASAALRPDGLLLITVPQHRWLWSKADAYAHHVRRYRARDLHSLVERAGFEILDSTSFVSLLLPALLAARLLPHARRDDPLAELRLAAPLNSALGAVMSLERAAIRKGVRFSAGGSRLVAARKHG